MNEVIIIHVTGDDRPGLFSSLTEILAEYDVDILDMGQSVIHNSLSLSFMIHIPSESESKPIVKDLLFRAHELGVRLDFSLIKTDEYGTWVDAEGKDRHIVTLLGHKVTAKQVSAISKVLASHGLNIDVITRLTGRPPIAGEAKRLACVEFSVRGTPDDSLALRSDFLKISAELEVDIAFQEDNAFRRNRRLVCFDMDSTLIQAEIIDELAAAGGVGEQVAAITESAMRGEIDFRESLTKRLALLEGLEVSAFTGIMERVNMTEGAEALIRNLKRFGYTIAIISGGFTSFAEKLQEKLGIDYVYANDLEVIDGKLTGRVNGRIVDAERKAEILREIASREGIDLQQVIAVGDGANDLPMLATAGLGIAFHAKPAVKKGARQAISTLGLDSILYLLGIREHEILA